MNYCLYSWVSTSSAHAYPVVHYTGTRAECEARRIGSNFPESLRVVPCDSLPHAY